jgi:hypothetical protein
MLGAFLALQRKLLGSPGADRLAAATAVSNGDVYLIYRRSDRGRIVVRRWPSFFSCR